MTIRERIFASRLLEKARRNPEYAREIGLEYKLLPNLQVPDANTCRKRCLLETHLLLINIRRGV